MPSAILRRITTSSFLEIGVALVTLLICAVSIAIKTPRNTTQGPASPQGPIVSSKALDEVRHLLVSADNPSTSTDEHLDFERCAALHNAIAKHAWEAGGRDPADMPTRRTWTNETVPEGAESRLHPDIIEFLKLCLAHGEGNFFQFAIGLSNNANLWEWLEGWHEDYIALYISSDTENLSGTAIICDQSNLYCTFEASCHEPGNEESLTQWQRLETILSAWLELIERGKIVALHHSVGNLSYSRPSPDVPFIDEATGARQEWTDQYPWAAVSYAVQDLRDALDAWHMLVITIDARLPETTTQLTWSRGLFSPKTLQTAGVRNDSFAWDFFTEAWRPSTELNIGPGLKLATNDDLINNPWIIAQEGIKSKDGEPNFPIPVLVGNALIQSWQRWHRDAVHQIPWGLYLDPSGIDSDFPVEDSCRLALPYPVGTNGLAYKADWTSLNSRNRPGQFELYQLGQHPFYPCRGVQLEMVLSAFSRHITDGLWKIGPNGVDEPDTIFQDADTEDGRDHYRLWNYSE
ncbi:hypothetical protein Q7P37_008586 [Cladosporium fusiforme]